MKIDPHPRKYFIAIFIREGMAAIEQS